MNRSRPIPGLIERRERPAPGDLERRTAPEAAAPEAEGLRLRGVLPTGVRSADMGGWDEILDPGCFDGCDMSGLICDVNHSADGLPLGRYPSTLNVEVRSDGLHWDCELAASQQAIADAVSRRDLAAGSAEWRVAEDRWEGNTRHIVRLAELRAVGPVSRPAYAAAIVEHRAEDPERPRPRPATQQRRGLRIEDRAGGDLTPAARIERAIAAVPAGELRDITRTSADPVEPDDIRTVLVERLRDSAVMARAGVPIVPTSRGVATWPELTGDVDVAFYDELEQIAESDPTFDDFEVAVKKLATLVRVSSEALEDSDPSLAQILTSNITTAMALKSDRELLVGNDPKGFAGLMNVTGSQSLAVGGTLTYDVLLKAAAMLLEAHVPPPYVCLMGPRPALALDTAKESGTGSYITPPASVPTILQTSHFAVSGGQTPTTSAVVFAPAQSMIVVRRDVQVEVDRSQEFDHDAVLFRGRHRLGFGTPHPESIVKLTGVAAPAIA